MIMVKNSSTSTISDLLYELRIWDVKLREARLELKSVMAKRRILLRQITKYKKEMENEM